MTQKLAHNPELLARFEQERRAGMPEIMKSLTWQTGLDESRLKSSGQISGVDGGAMRRREHEIAVEPRWSGGESFCDLTTTMLAEVIQDLVTNVQGALRAVGLWLS